MCVCACVSFWVSLVLVALSSLLLGLDDSVSFSDFFFGVFFWGGGGGVGGGGLPVFCVDFCCCFGCGGLAGGEGKLPCREGK